MRLYSFLNGDEYKSWGGSSELLYPRGCSNFHLSPAALLSWSRLFLCWTDRWHSKIKKPPQHILTADKLAAGYGRRDVWVCECVCGKGGGSAYLLHSHFDRYGLISTAHLFVSPFLCLSHRQHAIARLPPALVDPRVSSCYTDWQLYEPRRTVRPHCGGVKVCKMANICNSTPPPRNVPTRKNTAAIETQIFFPHLSLCI